MSVLVGDGLAVLARLEELYPGREGLDAKAAEAVALVAGQDV